MVRRVQTVVVSDLSGDVVDAAETVDFSFRGTAYTIDLTPKEAAGFDKVMAMYLAHASKAGRPAAASRAGRSSPGSAPAAGASSEHRLRVHDMKRWAADQGLGYPRRGRLPKSLVDAYDAAH